MRPAERADVLREAHAVGADQAIAVELQVQVAVPGLVQHLGGLPARHALPLAEGRGRQAERRQHVEHEAALEADGAARHVQRRDSALLHGIGLDGVQLPLPGEAVGGLGHVAGRVDAGHAALQVGVDDDAPANLDAAARQEIQVRTRRRRR